MLAIAIIALLAFAAYCIRFIVLFANWIFSWRGTSEPMDVPSGKQCLAIFVIASGFSVGLCDTAFMIVPGLFTGAFNWEILAVMTAFTVTVVTIKIVLRTTPLRAIAVTFAEFMVLFWLGAIYATVAWL